MWPTECLRPPGSSPAGTPRASDSTMFSKKTANDRAITHAPAVEIAFHISKPLEAG